MEALLISRDVWGSKGSKAGRSRSRSRSVSVSQSQSQSRSEWGGESDTRHSAASEHAETSGTLHKMLPPDNPFADLETAYVTFTQQTEMGPAAAYAATYADTVKPEFSLVTKGLNARPSRVWVYDESTVLWLHVDFSTWASTVGDLCVKELTSIANRLNTRVKHWMVAQEASLDDSAANKAKAWRACHAVALRAFRGLKWQVINNISEAAAVRLRDDAFFTTLDAAKDVLSFSNGVVDLRTGVLRARLASDRLTYALPYDYDAHASQDDIRAFVHQLFEDTDAEMTFNVYMGYCVTGHTDMKMFLQFSSRPHSGKSTFLDVLSRAMGAYCSFAKVPLEELSSVAGFEGTLADELRKLPPLRLLALDETHKGLQLNEAVVNQATSGLSDISLTLRSKHVSGVRVDRFCAKLVISSNHVLSIPSSSSGTAARVRGPPFKFVFVPAETYDASTCSANTRPADDVLIARLKSLGGRPGVAAYLVAGAMQYYATGITPSVAWDDKTFRLRCDGDIYIKWLANNFTPTGGVADRIPLSQLVDSFSAANKFVKDVETGMRSALDSMVAFVTFVEWEESAPFYNVSAAPAGHPRVRIVGVSGLVRRMVSHAQFVDCIVGATSTANEFRRDGRDHE